MALQVKQFLAGLSVPQFDRPVAGCARQARAVWTVGQPEDLAGMTLEVGGRRAHRPAMPESNGMVLASGGQAKAVGTERDALHVVGVAVEASDLQAGSHVPDFYGLRDAWAG